MQELRYFTGVDWGRQHHQVCVMDSNGQELGNKRFKHNGAGLRQMAQWILERTEADARHIGVVVETSNGPVVDTLQQHGFEVFSINPKQLDRYRDRFSMAGAKDDRFDARVLAETARRDRDLLRPVERLPSEILALRECVRQRSQLVEDKVRLEAQFKDVLWSYHPQFLQLSKQLSSAWVLELAQLAADPAIADTLSLSAIDQLLKQHRIRTIDAETVKSILCQPAMSVDAGVVKGAALRVQMIAAHLQLVTAQIKQVKAQMSELIKVHNQQLAVSDDPDDRRLVRDVDIISSMTGIGLVVLATLLAEAWRILRNRDYKALRAYGGAAPVTRRSGKMVQVVRRLGCNTMLAEALYRWARTAMQNDPTSKAKYQALRARGHSHGRCLRGLSDRLCKVLCSMLTNQQLFNPDGECHALAA